MATRFPQFIDRLIKERGDAQNTRALMNHLSRMLGRRPTFADLNQHALAELLNRIAATTKPATVRGYRRSLHQICRAAAIAGRIEREPDLPNVEGLIETATRLKGRRPSGGLNASKKRRRRFSEPQRHYRLQPFCEEQTLRHVFDSSYERQRLIDGSDVTPDKYRSTINRFSWFLAAEATVENFTDDSVIEFMAWSKAAGKSVGTINGYRTCLLALWRHAWRKRLVDELPRDVPRMKEPKRLPTAWTLSEFDRILRAAANRDGAVAGVQASLWWPALLLTLYDTGLRINAILHSRTDDVDLTAGTLLVPADHQKQNADQLFTLHEDTVRLIRESEPQSREMLFPWPHRERDLRSRYRKILQAAGLPHGPKDLFHKLRRTSGTHLARATDRSTVQQHLGHSHPSVTARYIDPRIVGQLPAANIMDRPTAPCRSA